ncbi:MAG: anaerobic ribonucleoside-triphosphate reductase activating protein [Candidatus Hydrogenedentes bacterium]|nr:anaerobic ribonucleoside-triphosphate reductase activating protein [Candidatus Hydrogenedentota bacterium]
MQIAGIQKCSLVDWPGKVAVVAFAPGCNLDCYFCHNRAILNPGRCGPFEDADEFIEWVAERAGFVDGVVISGGEPTLQPRLPEFVLALRRRGLAVKLDTNGTRPGMLAALLEAGLLDYVAMDIKAPRDRYEAVCGVAVDHAAIDESIRLLLSDQTHYEFRTTCLPELTEDDVVAMAGRIAGARRYVLQQFRPVAAHGSAHDPRQDAAPHSAEWFVSVMARIDGLVEHCETRGVDELAFSAFQVA